MSRKEKIQERPLYEDVAGISGENLLLLYNDEVNTFEHVIESLMDVCFLDNLQAEQCAMIAHFKGKCDVKKGAYTKLKPMKEELINRGLQVVIG